MTRSLEATPSDLWCWITANRSYERTHSAGGGNGGWVLAWVLGVAGGVALVAAFVVGGPKPQDSVPSASDSDPTTSTPDAAD